MLAFWGVQRKKMTSNSVSMTESKLTLPSHRNNLNVSHMPHSTNTSTLIGAWKASVGMYSGCDYLYKSCLCTFDPAIPTSSFNFIQLFLLSVLWTKGSRLYTTLNEFSLFIFSGLRIRSTWDWLKPVITSLHLPPTPCWRFPRRVLATAQRIRLTVPQ